MLGLILSKVGEDRSGEWLLTLTLSMLRCLSVCLSSGMRSGTVPHTIVVGLGAACEIASEEMEVQEQLLFGPHIIKRQLVILVNFPTVSHTPLSINRTTSN